MQRVIVAFRRDAESHWVGQLECGHARHLRHNPPLRERPWVLTAEGRASWLGRSLECVACDRRELPPGYAPYRCTALFDAESVPAGLLSRHRLKPGAWARIHVEEGRLRYRIHEPFHEDQNLEPGSIGVVLPGVEHEVEPLGPVKFFVEFYRPSGVPA